MLVFEWYRFFRAPDFYVIELYGNLISILPRTTLSKTAEVYI